MLAAVSTLPATLTSTYTGLEITVSANVDGNLVTGSPASLWSA